MAHLSTAPSAKGPKASNRQIPTAKAIFRRRSAWLTGSAGSGTPTSSRLGRVLSGNSVAPSRFTGCSSLTCARQRMLYISHEDFPMASDTIP